MKKFYLLLVALLAAVTVNAAVDKLYLIDNFSGEWNISSGTPLSATDKSGVFEIKNVTVSGDGKFFGFAVNVGSWTVINSHRYGPVTDQTTVVLGENAMAQTNNNSWKINAGTYNFTVDTEGGKLIISDPSSVGPIEPDPEPTDKWRVWSNLAGGTAWSGYDMTYKDGVWEVVVDVRQTGSSANFGLQYFKDKNVDSNVWYAAQAGSATVVLDTPMTIASSNNANFVFGNLDAGNYLFSLNAEKKQLTISAVEDVEVTGMRYAVRTNIFSGSEESIDFEEVDGKWQYTGEVKANGQILVVCYDEDNNETVYGSPTAGRTTNINVPLNLSQGNTPYVFNRHFTTGEFENLRNFRLIFDPAAKTLMLLRVGAPIYMLGTVDQSSWNLANRHHAMTNIPGTNIYYTEDFVEFKGDPNGDGNAFFLYTSTPAEEGDNENWNQANIGRYSPGVDDINLDEKGYKYQITKNTNDKAFCVPTGTVMRSVINLDTRYNEFYLVEHLLPKTMYLHGDLWKHSFDWSGSVSAQKVDNGDNTCTYTFEGMLIEDHGDGKGYFVLSDWCKGNSDAPAARVADDRAAGLTAEVAANGHAYTGESSVLLKSTYGDNALVAVTPNRYYDITLKMNNDGTVNGLASEDVTDRITTGIESVDVEDSNAAVEYYNMQGVRVANPENGMYICRKGNTVTKVFVK